MRLRDLLQVARCRLFVGGDIGGVDVDDVGIEALVAGGEAARLGLEGDELRVLRGIFADAQRMARLAGARFEMVTVATLGVDARLSLTSKRTRRCSTSRPLGRSWPTKAPSLL